MHPARRSSRPFLFAALAALLAVASLPAIASGADVSAAAGANQRATRQLVLGLSQHPDNSVGALARATRRLGRAPAIWSIWSSWGDGSAVFPSKTLLNGIVAKGATPMLFWQPVGPVLADPTYSFANIAAGAHDTYLRTWANAAKAWGKPILAKFAQEMNAPWFPWGVGGAVGNTTETFVAAWRHIWQVVRVEVGAANVKFVWTPYDGASCGGCPAWAPLYPGDRYVDWVGFSAFDWGGNIAMVDLLRPSTNLLMSLTKKPIMVAEVGTPAGDRKASWIRDGYRAVYEQLPRIRAIVYFDVEVHGQPDWRLTEPRSGLQEYRRLLAESRFQGKVR